MLNHYGLFLNNSFLEMTPKTQTKQKLDILGFIKTKTFWASENTIKPVKRQPPQWKNIFANHIHDMGLIFRKHNNSHNSTTDNHIVKMGTDIVNINLL